MIEVKNLKKVYQMNKDNLVTALDDISFTAQTKEMVAIVGSSGSGKSTLLNILGGLDRIYEGQIIVDNKDIKDYNPNTYRRFKVGTIFQQFNLISALNVLENVLLPLKFGKQLVGKEAEDRAKYLLDKVGLSDRLKHKPNELSGGQMQRVAIARALVAKPEILLADEPTGNLDSVTGKEIMHLLFELNAEENMTMFLVTHDLHLAEGIDRKLFLRDGQLIDNI
ncbi:ABC transporter ATP-binding protein [bacterium]|nr:ABC transporter ATP-binding protein [Candidatus Elulimicrobium humile]